MPFFLWLKFCLVCINCKLLFFRLIFDVEIFSFLFCNLHLIYFSKLLSLENCIILYFVCMYIIICCGLLLILWPKNECSLLRVVSFLVNWREIEKKYLYVIKIIINLLFTNPTVAKWWVLTFKIRNNYIKNMKKS